eukprot:m.46472 g.46472  ORF g.46472 m.46472 type:complete len:574 (-) comp20254_c0_seq1:110-1831(-)
MHFSHMNVASVDDGCVVLESVGSELVESLTLTTDLMKATSSSDASLTSQHTQIDYGGPNHGSHHSTTATHPTTNTTMLLQKPSYEIPKPSDLAIPTAALVASLNLKLEPGTIDTVIGWLGCSNYRSIVALPIAIGPVEAALLLKLGEVGLLKTIPVVLLDTLEESPRKLWTNVSATQEIFKKFNVSPTIFKPFGCETREGFVEMYGRDLREDDCELFTHVTHTEPLSRAMQHFNAQLRISARYQRTTKPAKVIALDDKWLRCDPFNQTRLETIKLLRPKHSASTRAPQILLVGAGPGDPNLLTVAAVKALRSADLVLADRLISKEILNLISAPIMIATKTPGRANKAQTDLDAAGLTALQQGLNVVRLKGGDSFVFGRGGEEVAFYRSHGYVVGVVPGVSSATSAAACAGIPVTNRGIADQLLVTCANGSDDRIPDLPAYVDHCTYVFLMGVGNINRLTKGLINHGFPEDTPAAIIQEGSHQSQRVLRSVVSTIASEAIAQKFKSPSTIVIGNVVAYMKEDIHAVLPFPQLFPVNATNNDNAIDNNGNCSNNIVSHPNEVPHSDQAVHVTSQI